MKPETCIEHYVWLYAGCFFKHYNVLIDYPRTMFKRIFFGYMYVCMYVRNLSGTIMNIQGGTE